MEKGVAPTILRIDAAAQIVPVAYLMDSFITDDFFKNIGGRSPVDMAQHKKAGIEPGNKQVREVRIDKREIGIATEKVQQVGAHGDEISRAARRAVHAPKQFLAARFGEIMQIGGGGHVGIAAIGGNRLGE